MLEQALVRLDQSAQHLTVDADVLEKLKFPRETIQVRLMIRMDDGSRKSFMAWRCRYDDTRGPTKGGIRFHPAATAEEVEVLAFWMTMKCAVMGLPYGGGKGAIRVDPSHAVQDGNRAIGARLCSSVRQNHRPRSRHSRARRLYEFDDHGLDGGRIRIHCRRVHSRRDNG